MGARLTRKEQQARTRSTLLASAARILACKGLHRASIDDIASDAGYTKGAFYANFKSKEELFLVMLDEHFAERLAALERTIEGEGDLATKARRAGDDFVAALRGDEEWCRLFLEFASHAARHEDFRREFVARNHKLRAGIAAIFDRRAAELGVTPATSSQVIAQMTFAMAHGIAIDQLLDPESTPDDLFGEMLRLFFTGVAAQAPAPAEA